MKILDKKEQYLNYFISICIQNSISIDIVSEKIDELRKRFQLLVSFEKTDYEKLMIETLPDELKEYLGQQAMIRGQSIIDFIFEDFDEQ